MEDITLLSYVLAPPPKGESAGELKSARTFEITQSRKSRGFYSKAELYIFV